MPDRAVRAGDHAVQFYADDRELAGEVGRHLAGPLQSGAVAIVIATEAHRRAFAAELESAGVDLVKATANRTLVSCDATETARMLLAGEGIDRVAFDRVVGGLVRQATETGRPVHVFGEIVAVLWDAGNVVAAIELEDMWNELGRELPFSLLCAYHSHAVSGPEHAGALEHVHRLHTHVLAARSPSLREISGEFPPEPSAPRAARRLVADALQGWGLHGLLLHDAKLVLSELATNAVVHARTRFSVGAQRMGSGIRLSVHDDSDVRPLLRDVGSNAPSGRGLRMVAALSAAWGVDATADGKTVWAELRA